MDVKIDKQGQVYRLISPNTREVLVDPESGEPYDQGGYTMKARALQESRKLYARNLPEPGEEGDGDGPQEEGRQGGSEDPEAETGGETAEASGGSSPGPGGEEEDEEVIGTD